MVHFCIIFHVILQLIFHLLDVFVCNFGPWLCNRHCKHLAQLVDYLNFHFVDFFLRKSDTGGGYRSWFIEWVGFKGRLSRTFNWLDIQGERKDPEENHEKTTTSIGESHNMNYIVLPKSGQRSFYRIMTQRSAFRCSQRTLYLKEVYIILHAKNTLLKASNLKSNPTNLPPK